MRSCTAPGRCVPAGWVVDYWSVLVAPDGARYVSSLTIDGVHPSPAGYSVMAPLVEAAIAVE